jgi:hypothetical protein
MSLLTLPSEIFLLIVVPLNSLTTRSLLFVSRALYTALDKESTWLMKLEYKLRKKPSQGVNAKSAYTRSGVPIIRAHDGSFKKFIRRRDAVKVDCVSRRAAIVLTYDGVCWLYGPTSGTERIISTGVRDCLISYYGAALLLDTSLLVVHLDDMRIVFTTEIPCSGGLKLIALNSCVVVVLHNNGEVQSTDICPVGRYSSSVLKTNVSNYHRGQRGDSWLTTCGEYGCSQQRGHRLDAKKYVSCSRELLLVDKYVGDRGALELRTDQVQDITSYVADRDGFYILLKNGQLKQHSTHGSTHIDNDVISMTSSYESRFAVCYITEPR